MSHTYVIINANDVAAVDFSQVIETSANTLRWNVDPARTKTVVKFNSSSSTPSFLEGKTQYTHAQILTALATSEWEPSFPPE